MPGDSSYAGAARQQAHQILSQPPYTTTTQSTPRPLAGVLHAIGHFVDDVFGPVYRWIDAHIFHAVSAGFVNIFGGWAGYAAMGLAVISGVVIALLLVRRRTRIAARTDIVPTSVDGVGPAELEAEADRLAAAGDFGGALRLRFEAGLLRLEAAALVSNARVHTGAQVAAHLGSPTFDELERRHEAVAYAASPASEVDVTHARDGWPRVVAEARRHETPVGSGAP